MAIPRKGILVVLGSLLALSACSSRPTASHRSPQSVRDVVSLSTEWLAGVEDPLVFNEGNCREYLDLRIRFLAEGNVAFFAPRNEAERQYLKQQGPETLERFFKIRLGLQKRFRGFSLFGCEPQVRESIRVVRLAEELLLEWLTNQEVLAAGGTVPFRDKGPGFLLPPGASRYEPLPGDVLLVRGSSIISASIARIGDEETLFSHLAIVGQEASGRLTVVESLVDTGAITTPWETWKAKEKLSRIVVYRQGDRALAKSAARKIQDLVARRARQGKPIPYDFALDESDPSHLYCAELVQFAYRLASRGQFLIPAQRSHSTKFRRTGFLESLGIRSETFFSPGDIETDPRFELVAEHRYVPMLRGVRLQDAAIAAIYDWQVRLGYRLDQGDTAAIAAEIIKRARELGYLKDKVPADIPEPILATLLKVQITATLVLNELKPREEAFYGQNHYSLSLRELLAIADGVRDKDCLLAEGSGGASVFHWYFLPPAGVSCATLRGR